jgi:hypothetical protein
LEIAAKNKTNKNKNYAAAEVLISILFIFTLSAYTIEITNVALFPAKGINEKYITGIAHFAKSPLKLRH